MKLYIVTPSFNSLPILPRCVRSVADQVMPGVSIHHHVQDGESTDGTAGWLHEWQETHADIPGYTFTYECAKDTGMYDALNTAWSKIPTDADITAHLNSDEQYLPNALRSIVEAAERTPGADVLLASYIVVDAKGQYICHKRSILPSSWISDVSCEISTCSCFHRVDAFVKHGVRLDTRYRSIADMVMYRELIKRGLRFASFSDLFVSVFAMTGSNLAWGEATKKDMKIFYEEFPHVGTWFNRNVPYRYSALKRHIKDFLYASPRSYRIFLSNDVERTEMTIMNPTTHWLSEVPPAESK